MRPPRSAGGVRRPKDQNRVPLSMRIAPETRKQLEDEAAQTGRSITQQAELRLEQSLRDEKRASLFHDAVYGRQAAAVLEALANAIRGTVAVGGFLSPCRDTVASGDWLSDPHVFAQVEAAVEVIFRGLRPDGAPQTLSYIEDQPLGSGIAIGILRDVAFAPDDSTADHAMTGAAIRAKIGGHAAERLRERVQPADED
jgi:hypothetical protein